MTEFELLYRSTLDLSMTTEEKDHFRTKSLSSFKLFNENCIFEGVKCAILDSNKIVRLDITCDNTL